MGSEYSSSNCAGRTSVKSHETDRENAFENQSPVFSYEQSPNSIVEENSATGSPEICYCSGKQNAVFVVNVRLA